jgi:hypothetical protein
MPFGECYDWLRKIVSYGETADSDRQDDEIRGSYIVRHRRKGRDGPFQSVPEGSPSLRIVSVGAALAFAKSHLHLHNICTEFRKISVLP